MTLQAAAAKYKIELICPASERQVARSRVAAQRLVEKTPALYASVVRPFIEKLVANGSLCWIDAVCSGAKERDRCLFCSDEFVINVDTKWKTHAPGSEDMSVRAEWKGAPWAADLYLLAISKDPELRSMLGPARPSPRRPGAANAVRAAAGSTRSVRGREHTAADIPSLPAPVLLPARARIDAECSGRRFVRASTSLG